MLRTDKLGKRVKTKKGFISTQSKKQKTVKTRDSARPGGWREARRKGADGEGETNKTGEPRVDDPTALT